MGPKNTRTSVIKKMGTNKRRWNHEKTYRTRAREREVDPDAHHFPDVSSQLKGEESLEMENFSPLMLTEEDSPGMETISSLQVLKEDLLVAEMPSTIFVSKGDPLGRETLVSLLMSKEDSLDMEKVDTMQVSEEDPLATVISEENPPVTETVVSEEDPLRIKKAVPAPEKDPLEVETALHLPLSEEDPLETNTAPTLVHLEEDSLELLEKDPLRTDTSLPLSKVDPQEVDIALQMVQSDRDPLEIDTVPPLLATEENSLKTESLPPSKASALQQPQDMLTRSLYQSYVQSFSVKYSGHQSFEAFFSQQLQVTGSKMDCLNEDYLYQEYKTFCNKKKTDIAKLNDIICHLAYLGLHETRANEMDVTSQKYFLGIILDCTVDKERNILAIGKANVLSSSSQPQGIKFFKVQPVEGSRARAVRSCKDTSLRSVLPTFPWQYLGRVSFETFCHKHLTITDSVTDQVTQSHLFSTYTTFCRVHNYQIALVVSIVFHLWFLGVSIRKTDGNEFKFCRLVMQTDEPPDSIPNIVIFDGLKAVTPNKNNSSNSNSKKCNSFIEKSSKTNPPQVHSHVASLHEKSSMIIAEPMGLAHMWQNHGRQSFEAFFLLHLRVTRKKSNVILQQELMSAYAAFCNRHDSQAAGMAYIQSYLKELGVTVEEWIGCKSSHYVFRGLNLLEDNFDRDSDSSSPKECTRQPETDVPGNEKILCDKQLQKNPSTNSELTPETNIPDSDSEETDPDDDNHDKPSKYLERSSLAKFFRKKIKITGNKKDIVTKEVLLLAYTVFCKKNNLLAAPPHSAVKYLGRLGFRAKRTIIGNSQKYLFSGLILLSNITSELRSWRKERLPLELPDGDSHQGNKNDDNGVITLD
ncbi:uncharacterized protein LOC121876579 [Homarus americanus]|uniref:Uncharacterized protein n=1 Tax=Homarus americanus TaxID=6706 RepID=A0A8J5MQJ8_HOMAM|nr:uncharacterized protein LOC121876579 [Homarus americanus]KAG7160101.1 hypothetical protein Hamer_G012639 [Homarus americanus]